MFPNAAIQVTPPTWQAERYRRGMIRWYPFDSLLIGHTTIGAGAASTLEIPGIRMLSGQTANPFPDFKCRAMGERNMDTWLSHPALTRFFGSTHYLQTFMSLENNLVGPAITKSYAGCYLSCPGFTAAAGMQLAAIAIPLVALFAVKDELGNLTWELHNAVGDGGNTLVTTLTGVEPPTDLASPGTQPRLRRMELHYIPNTEIIARIDGVQGARVTTFLPNVAFTPLAAMNGPGFGVFNGGDTLNVTIATFMGLMLESPGFLP